jgi:hypothetical protein
LLGVLERRVIMKRILATALGLLLLAGCGGSHNSLPDGSSPSLSAATSGSGGTLLAPGVHHVEQTLAENVVVDADVTVPGDSDIPVLDVGLVSFDSAKVKGVLFPDEQTTLESLPRNQFFAGEQIMTSRERDASCEFYSDDSTLMVSNLLFRTALSDYVFNVVLWQPNDYGNNLALFSSGAALPFASHDAALKTVVEAVKGLGLEFTPGSAAVYALDHQTMETTQKQMIASGDHDGPKETHWKSKWGVGDDCYFVVMDCVVGDLPAASFDTSSPLEDRPFNGSQIRALYSRDGLAYLDVSQLYSVKSAAAPAPVVPVEDAIDTVGAKFASLITASQYKITGIALRYVPRFKDNSRSSLQLVPAWELLVHELSVDPRDGRAVDLPRHILVDAYTGKEM